MSDQSGGSGGNFASDIDNPASIKIINRLGAGCVLIAVLLIYTLIASWPVTGRRRREVVQGVALLL